MRGGKKKWTGALVKEVNQVARTADVAADGADGFAERAHLDVHAAVAIQMVNGAAAPAAEDAGGMRVVHHHDAIIFFGQVAERGEIGDVAIHGKNAVGDE